MQKLNIKTILFSALLCVICGMIAFFVALNQQKKIGVVDAVKLFDQYNMKIELEGIAKTKLLSESKQVDSVGNALRMSTVVNDSGGKAKRLEYAYTYLKKKFEDDYAQSNRDINEKVWKRLNPLLDEFGKKKGLHLIIGANGMGSVLYNDSYYDQTNEAIKFINEKYSEGN